MPRVQGRIDREVRFGAVERVHGRPALCDSGLLRYPLFDLSESQSAFHSFLLGPPKIARENQEMVGVDPISERLRNLYSFAVSAGRGISSTRNRPLKSPTRDGCTQSLASFPATSLQYLASTVGGVSFAKTKFSSTLDFRWIIGSTHVIPRLGKLT